MNDTRALKIGFIGGGLNSAIGITHKIAAQMDDNFVLEAGCFSRHDTFNLQTAHKWAVPRVYDSYSELIVSEKETLDAVTLLTPTNMHTEIILELLENNIPTICEKTLTDSVGDATKIKTSLEANGGFLITTYNYTGYPMIRELEDMISRGVLGDIIQVNVRMPQESFIRLDKDGNIPQPQSWRLRDGGISTLTLDLGTHLTNLISFLTKARAQEVVAMKNSFGHYDVTDNMICMIRYSNNIDCQMWYSKSALGHKNGLEVEIYGTEGSASWYQMNPEFLAYNDNRGRNIILDRSSKGVNIANLERYTRFKSGHPAGFIEAFANYYDDVYDTLLAYKTKGVNDLGRYCFGMDDSLHGLMVAEAIERSVRHGGWEQIDA